MFKHCSPSPPLTAEAQKAADPALSALGSRTQGSHAPLHMMGDMWICRLRVFGDRASLHDSSSQTQNSVWCLTHLRKNKNAPYHRGSVQFSHSVVSDSLWPHGLQRARPPCPSPTPGACSDSCPLSHPATSPSAVPVSSCLQSFPASGSFPGVSSLHQAPYRRAMFQSAILLVSHPVLFK